MKPAEAGTGKEMGNKAFIITFFIILLFSSVCFADEGQALEKSAFQKCIEQCSLLNPRTVLHSSEQGCKNSAEFIRDVTFPDGTVTGPCESFRKVWRLKNTGTCTWDSSYRIVSSGLFHMGGQQYAYLDTIVKPGETADLTMEMTAPAVYGDFESEYLLEDGNGRRFGITGTMTKKEMPFWLKLTVADMSACSVVQATPYAVWRYADFDAVFKVKNNSEETWDTGEIDVHVVSGSEFLKYKDKTLTDLPSSTAPGETADILFDMIGPGTEGNYDITIQLIRGSEVICSITNSITVL